MTDFGSIDELEKLRLGQRLVITRKWLVSYNQRATIPFTSYWLDIASDILISLDAPELDRVEIRLKKLNVANYPPYPSVIRLLKLKRRELAGRVAASLKNNTE